MGAVAGLRTGAGRNDAGIARRLAHLAFWRPALRVLSYHRVHPERRDRLTVTAAQFERQLEYIGRSGFRYIRVSDLLSGTALPARPLLLSFDDGYVDNLELAQAILRRHGARATIFVSTGWEADGGTLMDATQLRALDPGVFELALHSHAHRAFAAMRLDEIEEDVRRNVAYFRERGIAVTPALAYPYGSRPGNMPEFAERLAALGVPLAFRLGNRLNRLPLRDPYQIQRIDVRGDRGDAAFRRRLWMGQLI